MTGNGKGDEPHERLSPLVPLKGTPMSEFSQNGCAPSNGCAVPAVPPVPASQNEIASATASNVTVQPAAASTPQAAYKADENPPPESTTPTRHTQDRAPRIPAAAPAAPAAPSHHRKSLGDILRGETGTSVLKAWDKTQAAAEFAPLPAGVYQTHVSAIELTTSKHETPSVKVTFEVAEGEHVGRRLWHDCWLTETALPWTKRDLAKLGITSLDQLERPAPRGIRCEVHVALRTNDDGSQFNRLKSFHVISIDAPHCDPFAPANFPPRRSISSELEGGQQE